MEDHSGREVVLVEREAALEISEQNEAEIAVATAGIGDEETAGGLSFFAQALSADLVGLAKVAERVGRGKAIAKQVDFANRVEMQKQLDDLIRYADEVAVQARALKSSVDRFRMVATEADRDEWTRLFVEGCHAAGRQVDGEYPLFRVFPVEVKTDFANDGVYINNRLVRILHPKAVASLVDREISRLYKEKFNAASFMRALVRAYDVLLAERQVAESGKRIVTAISLKQIHALLAIRTGTTASGYPLNQFVFDIYRLRTQTDVTLVSDGRRLVFTFTKVARDAIVIPLPGGQKEHLGSLELTAVDLESGGNG